jgi:HEAT repeat protein
MSTLLGGVTAVVSMQPPPVLPGPGPGALALLAAIVVLVACAVGFALIAGVLRHHNRRKEREWLVREEMWELPLLDVLSGSAPPTALWALVAEGEELYFVDYLLRYARRMRGSTRHVLTELARPYLAPVAERMRGGDPERRARAVETVALLGFGRYTAEVVEALGDPSPLVSMIAARNIARHQRPEHVPLLLEHAVRLSDWSPRQLSAVLASMGPESIPALRLALVDPLLTPAVRAAAADALRHLHDPGAVDAAIIVLSSATDRDVVAAALRIVGELGQPEDARRVRPLCCSPDPVIRSAAIQALTTTGAAEDHEMLRRSLDDESGWVAIQAARALKRTGSAATLRELAHEEEPRSSLARQVLLESA